MDSSNAAQLPFPSVTLGIENFVTEFIYNGQKCIVVRELNTVKNVIQEYKDYEIVVIQKIIDNSFPQEILFFKSLKMLTISDCGLSILPKELDLLQNLSLLDLSGNSLSSIPNSISKLQNLNVLDLSQNKFTTFPLEITTIVHLQTLDLSENHIDSLPPSIGSLKGLQSFSCSSNCLVSLPDEIGCLKYLKILRLVDNKLCSLPKSFVDLKGLLMVQLDNNLFENVPIQLFSCLLLVELSISHNKINGCLSSQFRKLANLRTLNLAHNQVTDICKELGELSRIEYLNFSHNPVKYIIMSICKFANLQELCLSNCYLREFPNDLARCETLVVLNASNNVMTEIPDSIYKLKKLSSLSLSHNNLEKLPSGLCQLQNLVVLELQSNRLRTLPREFGKLSSTIRQLDLSDNDFPTIPKSIFQSNSRLSYLNVDFNNITDIPDEIHNLKELTHFSVCGCKGLKCLPESLGSCSNLRVLRLSKNRLESLPNTFKNLKSLKYLDLSENNFTKFPLVVCFISRLRVLLYDQKDGKPLVTHDNPKTWYEQANLFHPESESKPDDLLDSNMLNMTLETALETEFTPGIPPLIAKLSQLAHFSVQHNGLFVLPDVFHLMNLRKVNFGFNRLKYLPPSFDQSRFLTHLYLHDNRFEYIDYSLCNLSTLRILTLKNNPMVSPPQDLCSGIKAKPVFIFLKERKMHEDFILRYICNIILNELPRDLTPNFMEKLGYSENAIKSLEKEFPGGYNHTKRLQYALEKWAGFAINPNSLLTFPQKNIQSTFANERSSIHSNQSVYTTWMDSQESVNSTSHFTLDNPISNHPISYQRLLHIINLLDLGELHAKLKQDVDQYSYIRI